MSTSLYCLSWLCITLPAEFTTCRHAVCGCECANDMANVAGKLILCNCHAWHVHADLSTLCFDLAAGVIPDNVATAAAASQYEGVTPQDSFVSASGFYSPRSQMASRRQSASSSEAWYDANSQMTSRNSSVTALGLTPSLPASQLSGTLRLAI